MSKELTVQQRAVVALGYDNEAQLSELAGKSKDLVKVTNEDSYKQIHGARMVLKNARIEIEKRGKAAREDATKFSKAVIEEEKRLIGLIEPEEQRLQKIQKDHDDAEDRAREAKALAEQQRVEGIKTRIQEIRGAVEACTRYDSKAELIHEHIEDIRKVVVDETFAEFQQEASDVKTAVLARLHDAYDDAVAREEEKRKAAEAQAELERLRAEAAAREAREREEREARERVEREAREAEEAAARARIAAEQAEVARKQKEQQDIIDAENRRLAAERAELERQQAEARRQAEAEEARKRAEAEAERKRKEKEAELAKKAKYPGERAILEALQNHFAVPEQVVRSWLIELRKAA